ncbi:hypothetical protein DFJ67_6991 [Asanoa ferruginea]|uniref:Uncharacterized protein n=1 Tax=Asanoa ferruginea TaxID=53367 RepID=A0A3D9ZVG0_9ACTN|nr:hypothetical protein [Asanoa ferruginea]REG00930.1 hypothetical protein DFJ67_6991 [Asanoa ferruginea]GIF47514.1 hypothetical protein Afe04nite_20530 [Asanoa ferruginea]
MPRTPAARACILSPEAALYLGILIIVSVFVTIWFLAGGDLIAAAATAAAVTAAGRTAVSRRSGRRRPR